MTGGSARHGRRDNGLFAAQYAAVGDVDPRIGEHLLDVLGNHGIAAYLQPTSDQNEVTRLTVLPARPIDRLYVDRSEMDTAREFLETLTKDGDAAGPAPVAPRSSSEFDNAWASIVAGFDQASDHETAPWPTIEDLPPHGTATSTTTAEAPRDYPRWTPTTPAGNDSGSLLHGLDSLGSNLPDEDDDEDSYHPPAPPPLPRLASITIVAIIGIIVGIAVLFDPNLLPIDPTLGALLGGGCLVASAVALFGRLRSSRDDDDFNDPGHGAVV